MYDNDVEYECFTINGIIMHSWRKGLIEGILHIDEQDKLHFDVEIIVEGVDFAAKRLTKQQAFKIITGISKLQFVNHDHLREVLRVGDRIKPSREPYKSRNTHHTPEPPPPPATPNYPEEVVLALGVFGFSKLPPNAIALQRIYEIKARKGESISELERAYETLKRQFPE